MWSSKLLIGDDKTTKYINDNAQNNKAFKKMRDIISAWKYRQDGTTKDILKKQSDRVAAVFDSLETAIANTDKSYTKVGLKNACNSFMEGRADKARAGAETFLDNWLQQMNDAWMDVDGGSGDENSNPNTKSDSNSKASRFAKLKKAREDMGTWSSPV